MTSMTRRALPVGRPRLAPRAPLALAVACALALGGCGPAAAATLSQAVEDDSVTARVSAVDGKTVTLQVMGEGEMGGPGQAGGPGGEPPARPEDNGEGQGGPDAASEPPAKPDGDGEQAQGEVTPDEDADAGSTAADDAATPPEPPSDAEGEADGTPPERPGDDGTDATPPEAPGTDGDESAGALPEGPGDGDGQDGDAQSAGGQGSDELTLTINDEGIIFTETDDGDEAQGSLSDIEEGALLTLSVSDDGTTVTKIVIGAAGGPGQGSSDVSNGTGATTYTTDEETSGETYASTAADENAVRVEQAAAVTLAEATVTKTGDSTNSEDSDFYGLGAGVLAWDGASLTVEGGTVTTDAAGANGIFAYGEGTTAVVNNTTIRTSAGNSGGIEVAGGAMLIASNLDIETQGESSAAIRSDRGGGTETVNGGSYVTHGHNSPAVYCTADVTVGDATLLAEDSEGVVIEGKNSVTLSNVDLTSNVNGSTTRTGVSSNVMIYQSMSGDASVGTGNFSMAGGSLTATHGTLFYVTNTDAVIELASVNLQSTADALLTVAGNDGTWGSAGSNGGTVTLTATDQKLAGAISVDDDSKLALTLAGSSSYEGAINSGGEAGTVSVTLETGATWVLTGDAYVSELSGDTSGIELGGNTLYVNGQAWSA